MADNGIKKYCLGTAVLGRGLNRGFRLGKGGVLTGEKDAPRCSIILPAMDSAVPGCAWGRISLKCELGAECVLRIKAFAADREWVVRGDDTVSIDSFLLDPSVPDGEKERLFMLAGGIEHSAPDMLLSGQEGRYLWLWLEVNGGSDAVLKEMRVYVPGDNFFHTLPQVYQNDNHFLRRYLTIFSTMYQEFQEEIDRIPDLLDVDTAPDALLPVFASWLGLETDETLFTPADLRRLLKAAPELLARKGSRWAVEEVVKLFVDGPVYVVERNLLSGDQAAEAGLYGDSPFDFAVMVGCAMEEKLRLRLQFLVDQFRPVRSRSRIVFLDDCGGLDAFTYLDLNGAVMQSGTGSLDDGKALTGTTYLN